MDELNITSGLRNLKEPGKLEMIQIRTFEMYGYAFDDSNMNWTSQHEYNAVFLSSQVAFLLNKYSARGYLFLNEVLHSLGLDELPAGQVQGWHVRYGNKAPDITVSFVELIDRPHEFRHWITIRPHGIIVNFL